MGKLTNEEMRKQREKRNAKLKHDMRLGGKKQETKPIIPIVSTGLATIIEFPERARKKEDNGDTPA